MSSTRQFGRAFHSQNQGHITTENDFQAVCRLHFDINWFEFEKTWTEGFQIYPNAIPFNPLQFCPFMSLLGFPVFCLRSSIVFSHCDILVSSMTIWSMLKLPKIAWSSPFKLLRHMKSTKICIFPWSEKNSSMFWVWMYREQHYIISLYLG